MVLFVVELLLLLFSAPPAGFTTVVLFSVFLSGVAGATVSVFCSQPTKSAAPARIRIYFFIVYLVELPTMGQTVNRSKPCVRPCGARVPSR